MDMCGKNQEKILRLQFQKRLNNKKVIREISDLLENFVWFKTLITVFTIYLHHYCTKKLCVVYNKQEPSNDLNSRYFSQSAYNKRLVSVAKMPGHLS